MKPTYFIKAQRKMKMSFPQSLSGNPVTYQVRGKGTGCPIKNFGHDKIEVFSDEKSKNKEFQKL